MKKRIMQLSFQYLLFDLKNDEEFQFQSEECDSAEFQKVTDSSDSTVGANFDKSFAHFSAKISSNSLAFSRSDELGACTLETE